MKFNRYVDVDLFVADVLDILLVDEARNNLLLGILIDSKRDNAENWLLSTVTGDDGGILLIAVCTMPFNLLLRACEDSVGSGAVQLLVSELRHIGFKPPGVIAERKLARQFADAYCSKPGFGGSGQSSFNSAWKMTMVIMKLEELSGYKKAPGFCRMLCEDDISFTPLWEHAFCVDCSLPTYKLSESEERIRARIGKNIHYIWVDGGPVAQAVLGRNTPNGAAISWVYTPPEYRGRGYATSVVAELTKNILASGKSFCCLFADAANPASCSVYRKLGYIDVCEVDEIKFI
jgi:hypothetical protein